MHEIFKDPTKKFVVSLFIQEDDFKTQQKNIEMLGNQKNVKLVVQPCPFEAIEFLYRIDFNIKGHINSFEKSYFWQALTMKDGADESVVEKVAQTHHAYLVAIIENDADKVQTLAEELQSLL